MKSVGLKSRLVLNVNVNIKIGFKPQRSVELEFQPTLLIRTKWGQIYTNSYTTQIIFWMEKQFRRIMKSVSEVSIVQKHLFMEQAPFQ